ncbi:S8 family serine peptidase [Litoribrevibacter albus]|uniref:S8 family serine peptidase n=1 Tax=Litoribrevibacter albus TaxID=1473156 RepID=UPI0024E0D7EA|nr:S8 family serine peptidase [Litoribrevibacter albus]
MQLKNMDFLNLTAHSTSQTPKTNYPLHLISLFLLFLLTTSLQIQQVQAQPISNQLSDDRTVVALFKEDPHQISIYLSGKPVYPVQILKSGSHWQASLVASDTTSVEKLLLAARAHPSVIMAERTYSATTNLIPNDPVFSDASNNTNHHQQIDSEEAWDLRTDCRSVVVAIVDTGVDQDHPDIADNLWINPNEVADNGIDDDNNGYIDDINGACVRTDCAASTIEDNFGHGSHVAGLLAAVGNNQVGVTGVCWNAELMIVKSLGDNGSGSTSDVAAGINYAVNNGADIINTSLTISSYSSAIESAIEQANQAGVLVIAAAGNFGSDNDSTPVYPANLRTTYDNLMSIANVGLTDQLYSRSNFGLTTVDIAAPGVNLYSTWKNGQYANSTGTSMASPIVAGIAALLMAEKTQSAAEAKARILTSARAISELEWNLLQPAVVNANTALSNIDSTPLALFRAEANDGSYQLYGYDLSNVDTARYTEFLLSGETATDITSFQQQTDELIQLTLPANSKSGVFQLYRNAEASNQVFIKRTIVAPSSVTFERDDSQLTLSWNNPQNADVISIERGVPGQVYQEIASVTAPNSVYQDTIDPEQKYYYRLRGSYDYIDPSTNSQATEFSVYSNTIITSTDDSGENFWLTESLPTVGLNSELSLQLTATASGTFTLANGQLPTGLSLSSTGKLTGTVTNIGSYTFAIDFYPTGTDQKDSRTFTMIVSDRAAGSMQLTDQQSLTLTVSASAGTLSSIQALNSSSFDSLDEVTVQLIQQILISNLPITSAEASEISITLANSNSGQINEIYLADTRNQWQNATDTSIAQVASSNASLVLEDGGEFDLDGQVNGEIIARVASASTNNTTESSKSSDSRCFIASAVYPNGHQDLSTLRSFRDQVLLQMPGGQWLVDSYYRMSPRLVAWMKHHPTLLSFTRSSLEMVSISVRQPLLVLGLLLCAITLVRLVKKQLRVH